MKAVVMRRFGGTEVLEAAEIDRPRPGDDEVLVRLSAAALNHLDLWTRQGTATPPLTFPHILGNEGAGEVAEAGRGVTGLAVGQRVIVAPGVSCGRCEQCASGWDSLCDEFRLIGLHRPGCYAEYVSAPASAVHPVSERLSAVEWSAVPLTGLTAWHMLVTRGRVAAGETVLIHAAGSGVSTMGIQIAKLYGARVIATAGSDEKLALARQLGADAAVTSAAGQFAPQVLDLTAGRGADLVLDHVGQAVWTETLKCLAKGGRVVNCGATSGPELAVDLRTFYRRQYALLGCFLGGRAELARVLRLVEMGRLRPVIDRTFPLAAAADAQRRMEARQQFGKIVLTA
jgi:NADPH:quinone reductase-like Zn-dependent oxidoreductase